MNIEFREWDSSDELPRGFSEWLEEIVREQQEEKGFNTIAEEIGVSPSILSRWLGGMGPLSQHDIRLLASKFGPVVYRYLHIYHHD